MILGGWRDVCMQMRNENRGVDIFEKKILRKKVISFMKYLSDFNIYLNLKIEIEKKMLEKNEVS